MRQICYKKWVRILAGILCILFFNVAIGSFCGFVVMDSMGIYQKDRETVEKEEFDRILNNYSVVALNQRFDDFGMEELSDTNFRYGVIQTDTIEGLDLNDKNIYEVCNFDKEVTADMLHVYSGNIGEDTWCEMQDGLFGHYYIDEAEDGYYGEVYHPIEACYYVRNTGILYYQANGMFYPEPEGYVEGFQGENGVQIDLAQEVIKSGATEQEYVWKNPEQQIRVKDMNFYLSDIKIVTMGELEQISTVIPINSEEAGFGEYGIQEGNIVTYQYVDVDTKPYYVLSYVNDPLKDEDNYLCWEPYDQFLNAEGIDFFLQMSAFLDFAYFISGGIYIAFFISVILCVITFSMVMIGAGHEKNQEGIRQGYVERIPFDILTCVVMGIVFVLFMIAAMGAAELTLEFAFIIVFFSALICECLAWRYFESVAIRIKKQKLWKSTLLYICWNKCKKLVQSISLLWKAWLVMGALAIVEFFGLAGAGGSPDIQIFLWFMEKVVLYTVFSVCLLQLHKLKQGAKKIADGETDSRIDTAKMFWDFKEHGENLNRMQEGIGKAVTERMKSERFKTELITNVSHDIKTPLTSIINYVNLLEKEDIDNPKAQEYLSVLSRQSIRLKKLIEDLMEASKASTGNLDVVYEQCDAGVMLTQTIGEFQEKLKAGQIELLVQNSEEAICIQADPRHLWRIFDNLMNNICKYAQSSTRAYVNIEKDEKHVKIIFRNISKYPLNIASDELMERFVRGDSSRHTEGNGLGLSIAKSLTELMHGTFDLVVDGDLFKVIITFRRLDS